MKTQQWPQEVTGCSLIRSHSPHRVSLQPLSSGVPLGQVDADEGSRWAGSSLLPLPGHLSSLPPHSPFLLSVLDSFSPALKWELRLCGLKRESSTLRPSVASPVHLRARPAAQMHHDSPSVDTAGLVGCSQCRTVRDKDIHLQVFVWSYVFISLG